MKGTLICNPLAGKRLAHGELEHVLDIFHGANWDVQVRYTQAPGDATRLAEEAASQQDDVVVVAGGDGTINEAIQGLAESPTALGYLPYGTVNVSARELNIPKDAQRAAREMIQGKMVDLDLGRANDRYFLLMAGIGFDGVVVRRSGRVHQHKHRFGIAPYVLAGVSAVPIFRGGDFELRYDGVIRRMEALMVVVANTRLYGGRLHLTPQAVANDGWLDVCIVKGRGPVSLVRQALPLLVLGNTRYSDVEVFRVRNLQVRAERSLPLQLDGELDGTTPVAFSVAHKCLRTIVPASFDSPLIEG